MPSACFGANSNLSAHWKHAKGMSLRYGVIVLRNLMRLFTKKSCYHQGFFAVKRRAVFILEAKWKALVRGWRRNDNEERGGTLVVLPLLVIGC